MWPSSVRRVATVAYQSSSPILSPFPPAASVISLSSAGRRYASQKRHSSSKPSSSDNGSKNVTAGDSVATSVERETKPSGEKRKRRSRSAKSTTGAAAATAIAAARQELPSVPSTGHLSQQAVAISSFFSLHRPISVTGSFPVAVTDDTFASIFAPKSESQPADVMSTLSNTVDQLEQPMTNLVIKDGSGAREREFRIYQHVENELPNVFDQINTMSGRFLPFKSPTGAVPRTEGAAEEASEAAEDAHGDQHVQYRAVITIDQTTKPDGSVQMVAHSPKVIMENGRTDRRGRTRRWNAISVKRLRKLKMKKHKYKKLMRKTRNIRRKLDRL